MLSIFSFTLGVPNCGNLKSAYSDSACCPSAGGVDATSATCPTGCKNDPVPADAFKMPCETPAFSTDSLKNTVWDCNHVGSYIFDSTGTYVTYAFAYGDLDPLTFAPTGERVHSIFPPVKIEAVPMSAECIGDARAARIPAIRYTEPYVFAVPITVSAGLPAAYEQAIDATFSPDGSQMYPRFLLKHKAGDMQPVVGRSWQDSVLPNTADFFQKYVAAYPGQGYTILAENNYTLKFDEFIEDPGIVAKQIIKGTSQVCTKLTVTNNTVTYPGQGYTYSGLTTVVKQKPSMAGCAVFYAAHAYPRDSNGTIIGPDPCNIFDLGYSTPIA